MEWYIKMKLFEKHLSTKEIFEGKVISVKVDQVLLEDGNQSFREVVMHTGGVCILPIDEDNIVYMVRQFRYPYAKTLLEVPAGKINRGEDPLECGKRELLEEVGATASTYEKLGEFYPTPAYNDEKIYMYLAQDLVFTKQNLDEDEFLEIEKYPLSKLVDMVMNGEICDGKTQVAVLKTARLKKLI